MPSLDLSSLSSPVPAARHTTQELHASTTTASTKPAVQILQQDGTCMSHLAGSDSDESNDSFDLFAPFKPPSAAGGEGQAASKADSEEGATATVKEWSDSNSHDSDEIGSDGPPDSSAHQLEIPSM
jgi:hypothetical protein